MFEYRKSTKDIDWESLIIGVNDDVSSMVIILESEDGVNRRIEIPKKYVKRFVLNCVKANLLITIERIKKFFK